MTVLLLLEVMAQPVEALGEDASGENGPSKSAKKTEYGKVLSVSFVGNNTFSCSP